MSNVTAGEVCGFLTEFLSKRLAVEGQAVPEVLPYDCDFMLAGMIDSMGILELLTALNEHFGVEIDFEGLEPESMTVVGPLCRFVSEQISKP